MKKPLRCRWNFHKWNVVADNGFTKYKECELCKQRTHTQKRIFGCYQPVNWNWIDGYCNGDPFECDRYDNPPKRIDEKEEQMELPKKGQVLTADEVIKVCEYFGMDELAFKISKNPPEKPFKSDGASCFPDEIGDVDIYPAAFWHDVKYWCGEKSDTEGRLIADCELAIDIIRYCGGSSELADIVLRGVRYGGMENLPTPWRWGFGR